MRVLITGANGHIGANLCRELLSRGGYDLVPMVRETSDLRGLEGLGLDMAYGDILDAESVVKAAVGCDAIINLAAVYSTSTEDADAIMRPAVQGIENVLNAAKHHGIKRVVHTSSVVAVGFADRPGVLRTEKDWNDDPKLPYYAAKTRSEQRAWERAKALGIELICVNPSGIVGPHDYRITPSTQYLLDLALARTRTVQGGMSYIDVRDVAYVHAEALERGVPGERYICAGENLTTRQVGDLVEKFSAKPTKHLPFPRWFVLSTVWIQERATRMVGKRPALSYESAFEVVGRWCWFDSSKAETQFAYTPRQGEETVRDTLAWLVQTHVIHGALAEHIKETTVAN
jgi:dihydroflavonol-4-reductase